MRRGFTLIELLVAIVIFSSLVALAAYSFRFYADVVKKITMPYPERAINFSYLDDAFKSLLVFVGQKKDISGKMQFYDVFYGKPHSVEFVSAEARGINGVAICRLSLDNESVYLECSPVFNKLVDYKEPKIVEKIAEKLVVFKNVKSMRLFYFYRGERVSHISRKIPELIQLSLVYKDNRKFDMFFAVKTNFFNKKVFTEYFYAPL
ncbi:type II secretion system protein [Persephonella sp.]